jgi:hypothetical protein
MFGRFALPTIRAVLPKAATSIAPTFVRAAPIAPVAAVRFLQHSAIPLGASAHSYEDSARCPTQAEAKHLPFEYHHLPHDVLLAASLNGSQDAKEELLVRNVMAVDETDWDGGKEQVNKIKSDNLQFMGVASLPYKVGLVSFTTIGLASFPLCFHLPTVLWFNDNFVTFEMAGEGELDTWLEVGSWSWNWMEPPLGQASFFILTCQLCSSMMMVRWSFWMS